MKLLAVKPGEEVIETLNRRAAEADITNSAIVSLIGAVNCCAISNMAATDARSGIITDYGELFELSGTGEISNGKVHVHVVIGERVT
ncbi:PCC domain-containing protein [Micromonospora sp. U56]|uniref:PCC domain-containing protein n=1 Tax=Micromonospora sp. U56 TaxID=2824900 RepID=UPI001FFDB144|nr:DUF296 domain-containing protein [Micromonospora sp. U56]